MPLYEYRCKKCDKVIATKHSMSEKRYTCDEVSDCDEGAEIEKDLSKSMSMLNTQNTNKDDSEAALAERVENHIEHLREESKETKRKMESGRQELSKDKVKELFRRKK